ncbi:MAG: hypothetical protein AUI36_09010 [Cyanobacteria bacterium 13_1_40CM_2_61_4]|nr:MAG: hypothetical protein AUI36_09010 [Cyanobacteria bacterium 13_1_40CM_2_61_4]
MLHQVAFGDHRQPIQRCCFQAGVQPSVIGRALAGVYQQVSQQTTLVRLQRSPVHMFVGPHAVAVPQEPREQNQVHRRSLTPLARHVEIFKPAARSEDHEYAWRP